MASLMLDHTLFKGLLMLLATNALQAYNFNQLRGRYNVRGKNASGKFRLCIEEVAVQCARARA